MKNKYLKDYIVEHWIRLEPKPVKGASNIQKWLVQAFPILGRWVVYNFFRRDQVKLFMGGSLKRVHLIT